MRKCIYFFFLLLLPWQLTKAQSVSSYEYWLDNDYEARHIVNGSIDAPLTIDLSSLSEGVHYFNFRAKNSAGQWGGLYRYLVYISHTEQAKEEVAKVEYWLDNETDTITRATNTSGLTISMDISRLQAGEHEFHCRLHSKGGRTSDTYSYAFSLEELQGIDVTFDGLVLSVKSDVNMKDALEHVGGRDSVASTIAAITWNSRIPLADADLRGITNPNLLVYVNDASLAPATVQNVIVDGHAQQITPDGYG